METLVKSKTIVEDELRKSTIENRRISDEKGLLLNISSTLGQLMESVKTKSYEGATGGTIPKQYLCHICDYSSALKSDIRSHSSMHSEVKPTISKVETGKNTIMYVGNHESCQVCIERAKPI